MQDILSLIARITRPRLLARAAKCGAKDYRRARHLPRLLGFEPSAAARLGLADGLPGHAEALLRLSEIEAEHEDRRVTADAAYAVHRHVAVLIAIAGEAALLRADMAGATLKLVG